jgi:hypothetical protein
VLLHSPIYAKCANSDFFIRSLEIYLVIRIPFVNVGLINTLAYSELDVFKYWAVILLLLFAAHLLIGFCNKYLFVFYNENMEKNIHCTAKRAYVILHVAGQASGDIL